MKALIYFCSIMGLFVWGNKMGEGMVVYNLPDKGAPWPINRVALSYAAQLGAGAPALPALLQNRRALRDNGITRRLSSPLTAKFEGTLNPVQDGRGQVIGTIQLEPVDGQFGPEVRGTLQGALDGQPITLNLGGSRFELDRPIKAGFKRRLECSVVDTDTTEHPVPRWITGSIPRSLINGYGAPPDPEQLQEINGRLGKLYELALVFTWIAGLLNILAIWDCVLGPAYGFGDEHISSPATAVTGESAATAPASVAPSSPSTPPTTPPAGPKDEPPRVDGRSSQKTPV